jgi:[ribosomal protein S5]-alanine N-acetyltransferase
MSALHIDTRRFVLRDFQEADRAAFIAYQMDPRYRGLYDRRDDDGRHEAQDLFGRFMAWQNEVPRQNVQVGIFERKAGRLCGCAGLRQAGQDEGTAVFGIELTPDDWGRYRLAIDVASALLEFGFGELGLALVVGNTSSGNKRVEKLAQWFGAEIVARREGSDWMKARDWQEVDWALTREQWKESERRRGLGTLETESPLSTDVPPEGGIAPRDTDVIAE